ncbi:hypothetical protein CRUP_007995 [Coryphaenoides rupestris]|nr:hypothetical protein CRUP_007995 [Coryphaenoides rupestris]
MPRVSLSCPSPHSLKALLAPAALSTLRDADVPPLFREPYILSGYRPVGLSWRCYVLSLFQMHNETLNVWSHLLAGVCMALRFAVFAVFRGGGILGLRLQGPEGQGLSLDPASLPLVIYVLGSLTYLSCRWATAAHLLHSHSELAHYSLFFLDYVFIPAAALLAWLTCASCCFAKLHFRRPYPLHRKLLQVVPTGLAYLLDISPVAHRLATKSWASNSAFPLHSLQMLLFTLAAFFFSCPVPERYAPGHCDNVGHGHQLFHLLLALCTLAQQEALFQDFLSRRPAMIRDFGEEGLLLACGSFHAVGAVQWPDGPCHEEQSTHPTVEGTGLVKVQPPGYIMTMYNPGVLTSYIP